MNDYSLIEKINILMDYTTSSPVFFVCSLLGVFILIFIIINIRNNKTISKKFFIPVVIFISIILLIEYFNTIYNIIDGFFDAIFMALYFPNLITYLIVVLILNVSLFYSLINKNIIKSQRAINCISGFIIDLFLIGIIQISSKSNVDLSNSIQVYSNSYLMVLFQLTMGIFLSWILVLLILSASEKLKKYDESSKNVINYVPEIIFDE